MSTQPCYHCGTECDDQHITLEEKSFWCFGCKTVYELLSENDMVCYYDFQNSPGAIPQEIQGKYDYLSNESIVSKLVEFEDDASQIVTLYIPHIHCSSCIWVLENLQRLNEGVVSSQVNFPKKTVRVHYNTEKTSLKEMVILLSSIGYEPYISLEDTVSQSKSVNRSLIYKLGISGFAFGNIMFLSFPEYFEVSEFWLEQYKYVFRWLMLAFSLPVVFYAAQDYFISAYKGLRSKVLNIDVPIALGIFVLFVRSATEVILDLGTGFFDSLSGLVFFLLLGKFFQQKTYNFLSFERDYKSYFPIAVTRIKNKKEENVEIYDVEKGDRLLIRNQELIPVDGILMSTSAQIDYSFVTGESKPVTKKSGDKIFAGGKQLEGVIEMEVLTSVSQSYLTQLWTNDVFNKDRSSSFQSLTDGISKYFTMIVISIALVATAIWMFLDVSKALNVFTAVLIIACPCAIALAAPFTLGNMLRIFGKHKLYLKNTQVIEKLAKIDKAVFDKTGTITTTQESDIDYDGEVLTAQQESALKSLLRNSNHPLSRKIYDSLDEVAILELDAFEEHTGKGIVGEFSAGNLVKAGSSTFVKAQSDPYNYDTSVHVSFNDAYKGKYTIKNSYRTGVKNVFDTLRTDYELSILSGDNEGEKEYLQSILPEDTSLYFNQKPEHKLAFIQENQQNDHHVMMVGDGLNDSGALAQSDVGIAVSEDINVFSPACDGILSAERFKEIPLFLKLSKQSMKVIRMAFIVSLVYNSIGLYFAVIGQLSPVIAAILMPLSSISIVVFTTIATNLISKKKSIMKIAQYIDHTLLKPTATKSQIKTLCEEAVKYEFYAVCVNGCYVEYVAELLREQPVKVAAVIGFPLGAMETESKVFEAKKCVENGADEIDMVINVSLLKSGCYMKVADEIRLVKEAIGDKKLKVIVETCYLNSEEIIVASQMVVSGRADFVKTSTGFGTGGAKLVDVLLMKEVVGSLAEIKASGGIRDYDTALSYINAGATRLGTSSGIAIVTQKQPTDEHTY